MAEFNFANPAGAMLQGMAMGQQWNAMRKKNAAADLDYRMATHGEIFRNALNQYGPGALAGDKNALAALFAADFGKAYEFAGKVEDRNREREKGERDRTRFDWERQDREKEGERDDTRWKWEMEDRAKELKAEEIAAEREEIEGVLRGGAWFYDRGDEAGYNAFLESKGIDPAQYPFQAFPAHAAAYAPVVEFMYELEERRKGPDFRQITGEEAAAMGLDPAKAYNVGKDGKVTAIGGGDTNINVDTGAKVGKVPEGTVLVPDPNTESGYRIVPVEGGKVSNEEEKAGRASELAMADYDRKFGIVDDAIAKAIGLLDERDGAVAGWGSIFKNLPTTDARTMANTIDLIKANLGFEELQAMRDASPTGGALGQVTERELAFLQAVQANLDQAQSPEELRRVLVELQTRRAEFRAERMRIMGGGQAEAPAPDQSGSTPDFSTMDVRAIQDYATNNGGFGALPPNVMGPLRARLEELAKSER